MAYKNKNMSVIAYANGFTLWQYYTDDKISEVEKENYFVAISKLCAVGDIIIVTAEDTSCFRVITAVAPAVTIGVLTK